MTAGVRSWPIRLTAAAEVDFQGILQWTLEQFGEVQAQVYADTLSTALESLAAGPKVIGAIARNDIAKGLFALHVARHGRKGRHFIMFRTGRDKDREVIPNASTTNDRYVRSVASGPPIGAAGVQLAAGLGEL